MKRLCILPATLALVGSGVGCGGRSGQVRPSAPPLAWTIRFRDVTEELGVRFHAGLAGKSPLNIAELMQGGVGWCDVDGDERPDLIFTGRQGMALFRNIAGKRFEDGTAAAGLDRVGADAQGVAAADVDGDGDTDLLVTRLSGVTLFRNESRPGTPAFREVTRSSGLTLGGWTTSAAFGDADGDGDLDLYIARYVRFGPGVPEFDRDGSAQLTLGPLAYPALRGVYYRCDAPGRFSEATAAAGLSGAHGQTLGAVFCDADLDGDVDLYLANDQAPGDYFLNDGRGRFRSVGLENGTALSAAGARQAGMGVDFGDMDRDGRLDLFVTTFHHEPKSLYLQEAAGVFAERSAQLGLPQSVLNGTAFGTAFADLDNDGRLDLLVANGHVQDQIDRVGRGVRFRQPLQAFRNTGAGFENVTAGLGAPRTAALVARGLSLADYDGDGKLDVAVANLDGEPVILKNESAGGRSLQIRLKNRAANRAGLGATVRVRTPSGSQIRPLITGRSYLSAFPAEAHVGLGSESATGIEVIWPGRPSAIAYPPPDASNITLSR